MEKLSWLQEENSSREQCSGRWVVQKGVIIMPMIVVDGPPIPEIERKRELVRKLYDAAHNVYGIEHITVVIRENPPENVGLNGELFIDRKRREQG